MANAGLRIADCGLRIGPIQAPNSKLRTAFLAPGPRPLAPNSGFTLLELLVAMALLGLVMTGIVFAFSISLNTWRMSQDRADLSQEARSIMGMITRDLQEAYLGPQGSPTGCFITEEEGLRFTTHCRVLDRMAYSNYTGATTTNQSHLTQVNGTTPTPASDQCDVRYQLLPYTNQMTGGLYRVEHYLPPYDDYDLAEIFTAKESDLVSPDVADLKFRFFDGANWNEAWDTTQEDVATHFLPWAVAVELHLKDPRRQGVEHIFESVVSLELARG